MSAQLKEYKEKRDFRRTSEPEGGAEKSETGRLYVIQKHAAQRLHYDFRIELDDVLLSWAVPKGPSLDPSEKRLAVHVEDHPVEYGSFEGIIPEEEYGGGTVMIWDRGEWESLEDDPRKAYQNGKLKFRLHGKKLKGKWSLVRFRSRDDKEGKNWLLIKERDEQAQPEGDADVLEQFPSSAVSARSLQEIAAERDKIWQEGKVVEGQAVTPPTPKMELRDPASLTNARKKKQSKSLSPQLATLVKDVPEGDEWLHEIKYDGYRLLCFMENRRVRLVTRNGKDWTKKFPEFSKVASRLPIKQGILDGELVAVNRDGTTNFQALQNALGGETKENLIYYLFDVPHCEGVDLTRSPLVERKELLRGILDSAEGDVLPLRYSDHIQGQGNRVFERACQQALEGLVCKRADSHYEQKRSRNWVKVKCSRRQEFVIGGYTDPSGARTGFGALLVGYYENDSLTYCGRVGTGFNENSLRELHDLLVEREIEEPPFDEPPRGRNARGVHWVKPDLVAEVEFTSWTDDGLLRHPSFKGLRVDKAAKEVGLETPESSKKSEGSKKSRGKNVTSSRQQSTNNRDVIGGVHLTHPDRILYPDQGITKRALAEYYESVEDRILPHIVHRPLTLLRCPRGHEKQCFYQKHVNESLPESIRGIPVKEKEDEEGIYIVIDDLSNLITLVQLGALEFHPWGSREDQLEKPDRLVFDLDPGEGAPWEYLIEGAQRLHDELADLDLESFVKTTGGKGLHVVVPLVRRSGWDEVKEFSRAIARAVVEQEPQKYLATMSKAKRKGKVFVDYLRNSRGATSIAAYSTRARPNAPISTPLRWEELSPSLNPAGYRIENIQRRFTVLKEDPWKGFFEVRQSITKTMKEKIGLD